MRQLVTIARAIVGSGKWRRSLAFALLFAIGCAGLSWWQFSRRADTAAANQLIQSNWSATPTDVDRLLPTTASWSDRIEWRPVTLRGTYLTAQQLLVRNRVLDGNPGFEVLTPLQLADGRVFVVDRGWLSIGNDQDRPDRVPAPPAGTVTVVARLQQSEPAIPGRTAPTGEIPTIDLTTVARGLGRTTYTGAYGWVVSETPSVATMPAPLEEPQADIGTDEGTHLSYAIQWIFFALVGFAALGWSVRQDLRDAGDPEVVAADDRAAMRRMRRAPSDTEVEDALTGGH